MRIILEVPTEDMLKLQQAFLQQQRECAFGALRFISAMWLPALPALKTPETGQTTKK